MTENEIFWCIFIATAIGNIIGSAVSSIIASLFKCKPEKIRSIEELERMDD